MSLFTRGSLTASRTCCAAGAPVKADTDDAIGIRYTLLRMDMLMLVSNCVHMRCTMGRVPGRQERRSKQLKMMVVYSLARWS